MNIYEFVLQLQSLFRLDLAETLAVFEQVSEAPQDELIYEEGGLL